VSTESVAAARPLGASPANTYDPYRYLENVLERLPTQPAGRIDELLPHRWQLTALDT